MKEESKATPEEYHDLKDAYNSLANEQDALKKEVEELKRRNSQWTNLEKLRMIADTNPNPEISFCKKIIADQTADNERLREALSRACIALRIKGEDRLADEITIGISKSKSS